MTSTERLQSFLDQLEMARKPLGQAKNAVESCMPKLEQHLIKLAVWGDSKTWRIELKSFVLNVQKIQVNLKARSFLTVQEYLDQMTDYTGNTGKWIFDGEVEYISFSMRSKKQVRSNEAARDMVMRMQNALAVAWARGVADAKLVDMLLDAELQK